MKASEIKRGEQYAVKTYAVSEDRRRRDDKTTVLLFTVEDFLDGKVFGRVEPQTAKVKTWNGGSETVSIQPRDATVGYAAVLRPWAEEVTLREAAAKQAEEERKAREAEWQREKAERAQRWARLAPAFAGIERGGRDIPDDQDLAGYIEKWFGEDGCVGTSFHVEEIAAIAERILELQEIVNQNALVADDA